MSEYVKIRSWHIVKFVSRAGWYITYCGRNVKPAVNPLFIDDELPTEKTCESCLRNAKRADDVGNRG
jgi:hypothetical protein